MISVAMQCSYSRTEKNSDMAMTVQKLGRESQGAGAGSLVWGTGLAAVPSENRGQLRYRGQIKA